jgi:3-hydroxyisobutyrate dehydrogenase-like beta-hydroxyacid dehydrogenase
MFQENNQEQSTTSKNKKQEREQTMSGDIGFVGLGQMGSRMSMRLLDAGYSLTVFDRDEAAMKPLIARGARRATSAAEVASASDTVLVSLPTPDIVHHVVFGPGGLVEGNRATTLIDLSTTGPKMSGAIAEELSKGKRLTLVDAPVSGGTGGAEKGTLAVMAACEKDVFESVQPILKVFGKVFFCGEKPGMGQTLKLANNMIAVAALAISSEAMAMGVKAGLDPQTMIDVIMVSSGGNVALRDKFPKAVLTGTFDFGFATGLSYKDVRLCVDEAEAIGVPMVVGAAVRQLMAVTNATFGPTSDFTSVARLLETWSGVEIRSKK